VAGIVAGGEQFVDQLGPLGRVGAVEELAGLLGGRDDAGDVEVRPAEELLVGAGRRRGHLPLGEPLGDVRVDQLGQRGRRAGRGGRLRRLRGLCHVGGLGGFRGLGGLGGLRLQEQFPLRHLVRLGGGVVGHGGQVVGQHDQPGGQHQQGQRSVQSHR